MTALTQVLSATNARPRQRPVEWWISVPSSTTWCRFGVLEFERDGLLEIEDGRAVHGEVATV
jgi:hypothetical protein